MGTGPAVPNLEMLPPAGTASPILPTGNLRPQVRGKFLYVNGQRFWVKGVTYGTFQPNKVGEPFPPPGRVRDDFAMMREIGVNTIRLYTPPPPWLADLAAEQGLYLFPDICWGPRRCDFEDLDRLDYMCRWVKNHTEHLQDHPAVLLLSIGNEIPPLVVRWHGHRKIEEFLYKLHSIIKETDPHLLTTYVNHPPTEYLTLPFLDVASHNVYLEREPEMRSYLSRLQTLAHDKPLLLAELGLDSRAHGEEAQANFLDWQIRAAFHHGLCGVSIYGWTDEWGIFDSKIEGWDFGLTRADRSPKLALKAVQQIYRGNLYRARRTAWPVVSVIVCAYNAQATIAQCLESLTKLEYPDYEVIVVNDGSTDNTASIAQNYNVRLINISNGGLSSARNLGIKNAKGEVTAFIDSDAYADPDWLYYMVTALEDHGAAAVGGPNLSPLADRFLSQCIDESPGNPTCVLVDNINAEHIPGCNMAYRKSAFDIAGMFDASHRAAGDDVDLCWRFLVADLKIVYHPTAIVWHHRRPSIGSYLKQQSGYGFAEAHLQQRYPGRFNFFGYPVWEGGVYDSVHSHLRQQGLPFVFRPKIYQGFFGAAQFQSLYQPFMTWWFQIFSTAEWFLLTACTALSGALSASVNLMPLATGLSLASLVMFIFTLGASFLAGWRGIKNKKWHGKTAFKGLLAVALLHILQPVARTHGRVKGRMALRKNPIVFPDTDRLQGNLAKRDIWLQKLLAHMKSCGWIARPCDEWDDADIEVLGPGPYTLKLISVYEEDLQRGLHYVRYRVTNKMKPHAPIVVTLLMASLFGITQALYLTPLAIPLTLILIRYVQARKLMTQAVSQMAMDCGWPIGMPKATVYY